MSFEKQLLDFLASPHYRPMKQHELVRALHINQKGSRTDFRHELYALEEQGKVVRLRKNRWSLPNQDHELTGTIRMFPKGGGIVVPDSEDQPEIYVSERNTGVALPGDQVAVEVFHSAYAERQRERQGKPEGDLRAEGRVSRVLTRKTHRVVGLLMHTPYYSYIIPDKTGFSQDVHISKTAEGLNMPDAHHKVVVELEPWADPFKPLTGVLVEDLGDHTKPGIDVDSLLHDAGIQQDFPEEVIREAEQLDCTITDEEIAKRRDLRDAVIFTIDPETAKDYDDAISLEPQPDGGWKLGVHIADVSHFVKPGTKIDKEAQKRGNSIYLVDRCVMMLPTELTTRVCSLNPQNDHLAHSVELLLTEDGDIVSYESFPSIIHSKARLNYTQVQKFINGEEDHGIPDIAVERLKNICPLVKKIRSRRVANGSVEISTPEIEIKLNEQGKIEKMMPRSESKDAYQLIEDCMLLANRAVAKILLDSERPSIYRVHDEPDPEQWAAMGMELQALGIDKLPQTRQEINEAIQMAVGSPVEYTANLAILRNFKRAEYATEQIGHFGLAFEDYTHFTSPIRRYPDLLVHRMLKAIETNAPPPLSNAQIEAAATHCNDTERKADELEKQSIQSKRIEYYNEKLNSGKNETFKGYIVSIKHKGMIVELPDSLQRGMISFSSLSGEWLEANAEMTAVQTRNGRTLYTIGETIEVALAKVDPGNGFVDFILADQLPPSNKRQSGKRPRIQPDLKTGKPRYQGRHRNSRKKRR